MDKLTFATAGSVDNGKSTLIGRLLYDSGAITQTQKDFLNNPKNFTDDGNINLSLLTDGLSSEKEQGITIDVAYKYFQTKNRRFIIADTPGHQQYTRNTVTGISNAHLGIVLLDARHGITAQVRRHSAIFGLLQTQTVVVCVNKMDMVAYNQDTFNDIVTSYQQVAIACDVHIKAFIPTSAFFGDNVVHRSDNTPWYQGKTLLDILETAPVHTVTEKPKFGVQTVIRPMSQDNPDYRGYAGRVNSGQFRVGDTVTIYPSGLQAVLSGIELYGHPISHISQGMSGTLLLDRNIDISNGDVIAIGTDPAQSTFDADICWFDDTPLNLHQIYSIRHLTKFSIVMIENINYSIHMETLQHNDTQHVEKNDIANITVRTQTPLPVESFTHNKQAGQFILIDQTTHQTVAVGMIRLSKRAVDYAI